MNAYVYGYGRRGAERLILVDLGVAFADMESTPGVDLIFPDMRWLIDNRERLEAIFLTHGHEDHLGALGHFWSRLRVPVYARPFTSLLARGKLSEQGQPESAVHSVDPRPAVVPAGPFQVSFVPIPHSIPESSALLMETPAGRVVHSGDFKLDPAPVIGPPFDAELWGAIGKQGVHALLCDSTNSFSPHPGRSEASIIPAIDRLVQDAAQRVVATTFASNVARVATLARAGQKAGRSVCLMGRAMQRMIAVARQSGVLQDFPETIRADQAARTPREHLMLIVTGSQGERRAASAQLANGTYNGIDLQAGDLFLFSSKTIPGNEKSVIQITNQLSRLGVDVVDDTTDGYHVSGHANRPDLRRMHDLLNPAMVLPMHGEHRHLRAHAALAQQGGRTSLIATNGSVVDITEDVPQVVETVPSGRVYLDGKVHIGALDGVVRDRLRMAMGGHVVVSVLLDEAQNFLEDLWVETMGLAEPVGAPLDAYLTRALTEFLQEPGRNDLGDGQKLERKLRRQVRERCFQAIGKKPQVAVVVSYLG